MTRISLWIVCYFLQDTASQRLFFVQHIHLKLLRSFFMLNITAHNLQTCWNLRKRHRSEATYTNTRHTETNSTEPLVAGSLVHLLRVLNDPVSISPSPQWLIVLVDIHWLSSLPQKNWSLILLPASFLIHYPMLCDWKERT
jgi:hypothetical protein